jgi:hypothetical protein
MASQAMNDSSYHGHKSGVAKFALKNCAVALQLILTPLQNFAVMPSSQISLLSMKHLA